MEAGFPHVGISPSSLNVPLPLFENSWMALSFNMAIATSGDLSPLKSPTAIEIGKPFLSADIVAGETEPSPFPKAMPNVVRPKKATSNLPSPLKSATATESPDMFVVTRVNVPSPLFSSTLIVDPLPETTTSGLPSPLKSATAIAVGFAPAENTRAEPKPTSATAEPDHMSDKNRAVVAKARRLAETQIPKVRILKRPRNWRTGL